MTRTAWGATTSAAGSGSPILIFWYTRPHPTIFETSELYSTVCTKTSKTSDFAQREIHQFLVTCIFLQTSPPSDTPFSLPASFPLSSLVSRREERKVDKFQKTARRRRAEIFWVPKLYFQEFHEISEFLEILSKFALSKVSRWVKLHPASNYFQDVHGRVYQKIKIGLSNIAQKVFKKNQLFQKSSMEIIDFEQNLHQNSLIIGRTSLKIMNWHVLVDKNHQNQSKTIKNRKNTSWIISRVFPDFSCKIVFFTKISTFWYRSLKVFSRFHQIGHTVHPTVQMHQNPSKSEGLMLVEKIDLVGKKSPKIENFIFCFFNFHIS